MNTNALKKFAQEARRKLIEQVGAKLDYVLSADTPELREKATQVRKLKEELNRSTKEQVVEKVAYTWFNRLMALRFMDANDYQPIGVRVVSPQGDFTTPELLNEAKQGNIPAELNMDNNWVLDVLNGKIPSSNPQNEAYKALLIAACNHLHSVLPFLFERINDYTELLLPDDLTSEFSIVHDLLQGMSEDDCQEVEIIGWLYQFYISERKDELINAKKRYKADEIAPVTQLFTPRWIVEYMVDNSLGQLWKEARPNTNLCDGLKFYIKPQNPELIPQRKVSSPEDITFFDPCVGSAHVLCYAFDLFYKIYEEEGYNPSEIPALILRKNLYGIDIDDRATQLAGFALMMKGRSHNRRFLQKAVQPNITAFQNIESHPKFENAKVLGSLIKISPAEVEEIQIDETSLFADEQTQLKKQASLLANKYDVVVTNPPYLNSSYMEGTLKQFVEKEYKETKSDLFACFLIQASNFTKEEGLIGFICPYVWMFIKSYEWLREFTIENTTIASLVQLEYNAFGPAVVPIGTFVLRNELIENYNGSYVRLSDFKGVENQEPKTLEAINNPNCEWYYSNNQFNYLSLPSKTILYNVSDKIFALFINQARISDVGSVKVGLFTCNNDLFLRRWFEVSLNQFDHELTNSLKKWKAHTKGGSFRKWYGNFEYVVNYGATGQIISSYRKSKGQSYSLPGKEKYFLEGVTWSHTSSSTFSARYVPEGFIHNVEAPTLFDTPEPIFTLGLLNSKVSSQLLSFINPTLHFLSSDIAGLPWVSKDVNMLKMITNDIVATVKEEYDSVEFSWQYAKNELLKQKSQTLEESFDLYQAYWKNKFLHLHRSEEELNSHFIEIYGLQDELTPDVPLEDITILKEETSIENGQLVFHADEVFAQFVSYSVGCMFGRYSLEKEGLVLANQGETLEDYLEKIGASAPLSDRFLPDDDNIIPVLEDEWFEDDITGRFYEFLKVTFGKANFQKNLAFVEESLGKDIRKYFVKDFYKDHIKRYKKRPIYWMFSSPKGSFSVLIYMHRYTPDTLNQILNGYLREFIEKLKTRKEHFEHIKISGSAAEQSKAIKEIDKIDKMLLDCQDYEREILYPLATERIAVDLDDGVLVNYNKFGKAIQEVSGLNDKKTKDKVRKFDWIDNTLIR